MKNLIGLTIAAVVAYFIYKTFFAAKASGEMTGDEEIQNSPVEVVSVAVQATPINAPNNQSYNNGTPVVIPVQKSKVAPEDDFNAIWVDPNKGVSRGTSDTVVGLGSMAGNSGLVFAGNSGVLQIV